MKPVMTVLSFFLVLTLHSIGAAETVQKGSDLGRRQKSAISSPSSAWIIPLPRSQYLHRQGADRGPVQTTHKIFRGRDQQGTDGDDNAFLLRCQSQIS